MVHSLCLFIGLFVYLLVSSSFLVCLFVCLFCLSTRQVAVLLTDGKQTEDTALGRLNDPAEASKDLQNAGVHVYSFGIGKEIDRKTLLAIASYDQKQVFFATTFEEMEVPAKQILASVCQGRHLLHC